MKAHELFQRMSPELATEIFAFLKAEQKPVFKAAVQGLANQRNLRSVFIERKPAAERSSWLKAALARPMGDALASHLLQAWLLGANKPMLCQFLDSLGVAHGEDGTVDTLPPSMEREKLKPAVDQLLAKFPAEVVAVYLHAFKDMDAEVKWPALGVVLDENPRLNLSVAG